MYLPALGLNLESFTLDFTLISSCQDQWELACKKANGTTDLEACNYAIIQLPQSNFKLIGQPMHVGHKGGRTE